MVEIELFHSKVFLDISISGKLEGRIIIELVCDFLFCNLNVKTQISNLFFLLV